MSQNSISGVSAANIMGEVILFVDGGWREFVSFSVVGNAIDLEAPDGSIHSRTYGHLTVETARNSGKLLVLEVVDGKHGRSIEVEAARGR